MTPYTQGTWLVKPGREQDFMRLWQELADWSVTEGFTGRGTLFRDLDHPARFVSIGPWSSLEEIEQWRASAGFREGVERLRDVLESFEPPTLELVRETS